MKPYLRFPVAEETWIQTPPLPEWEWCFSGDWRFRVTGYTAPNRFHRMMQRVLLGIHWRKISKP